MNQKRTNTKRTARQMPRPEAKPQGVTELTDADLEQVQGGTTKLMQACTTGKHIPEAKL